MLTGLDQSHNECVKLFWRKILDRVVKFLEKKDNSLFNPQYIKEALDKHSTVLVYMNKNYNRSKENKNSDSDTKYSVIIEIVEKMASGQGYTTVLNTSLMCFLMEFIKYKFNMNVGGKISGDDVALVTSNSQDQWSKVLGYVFSKKGANYKGGVGLVLKYFRYGELDAISPCSLLAFVCPKHGLRLVRQYQRFLKNFFYSQKMLQMPDCLRYDFFATVCQGERYWSQGYRAFNIINNWPKPSKNIIPEICKFFSKKSGKSKFIQIKGVIKSHEQAAQDLFFEKGVDIGECKFWTTEDLYLFKEIGWIRNETLNDNKKLPVYPCCSDALDEKLASINPNLIDLDPWDFLYAADDIDKYYEELNKKVDYKYVEKNIYDIFDYKEAQETKENDDLSVNFSYRNHKYFYPTMLSKIKKTYEEDISYFKAKIRKYNKYFIA